MDTCVVVTVCEKENLYHTNKMAPQCVFCGTARNCAQYLSGVLKHIRTIGEQVFDKDYYIVIYIDPPFQETLTVLKCFQQVVGKNRMEIIQNRDVLLKHRTHRLAKGRNACLDRVRAIQPEYFIVLDLDDVNCKQNVNIPALKKHLLKTTTKEWDALSFQTKPNYYDIWALSIYPFCFSYNHLRNSSIHNYHVLQSYVTNLLNKNPQTLLPCLSAFNGFAIYKTSIFTSNTFYDGHPRPDLLPNHLLAAHKRAAKCTKLIGHNYGHVDGKYEDCEHRAFHYLAIQNNQARIRISSDVIFY